MSFLRVLNLFETVSVTADDAARTTQYQEESKRRALQKTFANEAEFLRSLEMVAKVEGFTEFNTPRVAQLTQRSNQFNLRTIRYTQEDIARIARSPDHVPLALHLEDRFGQYGIVSVIILQRTGADVFVDTWLMSCRVLKRGVEQLALNVLASEARRLGAKRLVGEYIPPRKNTLVREHYRSLGFHQTPNGHWELDIAGYVDRVHHISGAST